MSRLNIENLSIEINRSKILQHVDLSVELEGHLIGILGPNGAGKSTLFNCITGFNRSYLGNIHLADQNLNELSPSARTSKGLGYLPQESWLFSDLSVRQNLTLFGELKDIKGQKLNDCINRVLNEMKISHLEKSISASLSGGEKRRLEFARTLMFSPKILLLDEPFTGIDPKTVSEITKIIQSLKARGISIFISDHQAETILKLVDAVYIIYNGQIVIYGPPEEVKHNQQVQDIYLGKDLGN